MNQNIKNPIIQKPVRKSIRLPGFDYTRTDVCYFLTLCAWEKNQWFPDHQIAGMVMEALRHAIDSKNVEIYCYCLMPDHLHLLMKLEDKYGKSLQDWVTEFKRWTSHEAVKSHQITRLWQQNFHDHVIRTREELESMARYVVDNPVRKRLVMQWQEYPHSWIKDSFW